MGWSDAFNLLLVISYFLTLRRIGLTGKRLWMAYLLVGLFVVGGGYFVRMVPPLIFGESPLTDSILGFLSPAVVCLLPFMVISAMKWPIERRLTSPGLFGEIRS